MIGLLLILLFVPALADGPKWSYRDNPKLDDEMVNIYYDIRNAKSGRGTSTNNDACTGCVGEYAESTFSGVAAPTTLQFGDATSISLTAGDWDVEVHAWINTNNAASVTYAGLGVSTTSGNSSTGMTGGQQLVYTHGVAGSVTDSIAIPRVRMSLSSTTTVYAKYIASYSATAPNFSGMISARRVR